ncbi:MAG: hypothetical protein R3D55_02095 [Chloroflexota bacterium]
MLRTAVSFTLTRRANVGTSAVSSAKMLQMCSRSLLARRLQKRS